jgi:hypothetical protein
MSAHIDRHRIRAALLAAAVLLMAAPAAQAATTPEDIDAVPRLREQLRQADTGPVASAAPDGFEWGDAGVGAAAALVLVGVGAGGGIAASRLRRGQRPSHGLG